MFEIVVPSLVGALLAISWYWVMDLLPPFRAARRTAAVVSQAAVPAPAPEAPPSAPAPVVPAPEEMPLAQRVEVGAGIGQMIGYMVIAAAIAKRQQAQRIAVLQTGKARADIPALQEAVGAAHDIRLVSVDEALETRFDILVSVGDEPGAVPGSILMLYDMNLKLEALGENVRVAVGTPRP